MRLVTAPFLIRHTARGDDLPQPFTMIGKHNQQVPSGICLAEELVQPIPVSADVSPTGGARLFSLFIRHAMLGFDLVQDVVIDVDSIDSERHMHTPSRNYIVYGCYTAAKVDTQKQCRRSLPRHC